jgi:tRNA pseudouridine55 synthase
MVDEAASPPEPVQPSGVLLVDKPLAWTSHDVVKFIRRFGFKKVGHCGTLDPAATGLLIVVIGRATKLTDLFAGQDKTEADWTGVTEADVRRVFGEFVGEQMQVPPMVSAKKQGGETLYKLARKGIVVEREPRPIVIHSLDIREIALPEVKFEAKCSKGTYIRTLSADIGTRLGCGAHLNGLCRTVSGRFSLTQAVSMDSIKTWNRETLLQHMLPLERALAFV